MAGVRCIQEPLSRWTRSVRVPSGRANRSCSCSTCLPTGRDEVGGRVVDVPVLGEAVTLSGLRTRDEITDPFSISSSGHLGPLLNREILNVAGLRLRFRSIVASQSDPNLSGKCITYFIAGPYARSGHDPYRFAARR